MAWNRNVAGIYSRPLSHREYLSQLIGSPFRSQQLEDWFIHATVIMDSSLSTSSGAITLFQHAWQQLRFEYPGIAAELTPDGLGMQYESCVQEHQRKSWLSESFAINEDAVSTNDVYGTLSAKKSSFLCIAPKAQAIVLCVQHWHGDGRGVLYLLGRFLDILRGTPKDPKDLRWGSEEVRLPISVEALARLNFKVSSEDEEKVYKAARAFLMMDSVKGIEIQGDLEAPPEASQLERIVLSKSKSDAIMQAAKSRGLSVTAIFHAAACLHNIQCGDARAREYPFVATVRRDLRKFLNGDSGHIETSADTLMASSSFIKVDPSLNLLEFASILQGHYRIGYTEDYFKTYDAAICTEIVRLILSGSLSGLDPTLEVQFSSLGKLDDMVTPANPHDTSDKIRTRDVEFGLTTYSCGVSGMWLYSFNGQINMSIVYNKAFRTSEAMLAFLNAVEVMVCKGLAVDLFTG